MTHTISPISQFYSLMVGPVLWFAHFLLVWGMAEFGCRINFRNLELVSPANIQTFVLLTTIVALIAIAIGGVLGYRNWVATQEASQSGWAFEDRHRFLAVLAMLLCGLFLFSIVVTAMPAFYLNICDLAI